MIIKNTTKPLKFVITLVSIACLIGLFSFFALYSSLSNTRDNQNSAKQNEMIAIVLEWGRLAPFPANATDVSIEAEGSSFTRSFHASFVASKQDIQAWVKDSPGISEATPEELSDNQVEYVIVPGGGANSARVNIDFNLNKVDIYVSWS